MDRCDLVIPTMPISGQLPICDNTSDTGRHRSGIEMIRCILDAWLRCQQTEILARTPPRPHGSINASEKEDKEKKMTDREQYTPTAAKLWNWRLWAGFGLSIGALAGYGYFVMETRAVFWPALLLFVVAAVLLVSGLKHRSRQPESYRGKIAGPVLTTLSVLIFGLFGFVVYEVLRVFPDAKNAPQIGQRAPEFSLVDANGTNFTLAQLLSTPITNSGGAARATNGVLVLFYRGYW